MIFLENNNISKGLWNEFVDMKIPYRFEWLSIIQRTYKLKPFYVLNYDKDDFALVGSFATRTGYISIPYLSYSGYLYSNENIKNILVDFIESKNLNIDSRDILSFDKNLLYTNSITKANNIDELWKKIDSKTRNQIRKLKKVKPEITISKNNLDIFYSLYIHNMKRLGTPPHAKKYYANILEEIKESSVMRIAVNGEIASSSFIAYDKDTLYNILTIYNGSYLRQNINEFTYWSLIEESNRRGLSSFDMGRSSYDSGTYKFKQKFYPDNYSIRSQVSYDSKMMSLVSELWKRIPVQVTKIIGPYIRKYLP